jgi:uncharacterized protein YndB with AHSA1/START domain
MPDILHDFPIAAPIDRVFDILASAEGLDAWWTKRAEGAPGLGNRYKLWFGPEYDWAAVVRRYQPPTEIEWELTEAHADWIGTRVGFRLAPEAGGTQVQFYHVGWPESNQHYRISTYCWAMYLRVLRRYIEFGETVAYEDRLNV